MWRSEPSGRRLAKDTKFSSPEEAAELTTAAEPASPAVAKLKHSVESYAFQMREWYLSDKTKRKRASKLLRGLAILLTAVGLIVPVLPTPDGVIDLRWGYVAIAVAGACVGLDRFFGISSGWMRDIQSAQAIDEVLIAFYSSWVASHSGTAAQDLDGRASMEIGLVQELAQKLAEITSQETALWRTEFEGGQAELRDAAATSALGRSANGRSNS